MILVLRKTPSASLKLTIALISAAILSGCGKPESEFIELSESAPPPAPIPTMQATDPHEGHDHGDHEGHDHASHEEPMAAGHEANTDSQGKWHWDMPESWTEIEPGRMQKARFIIGKAPEKLIELSISAFPGEVGTPYSNLNRWRQQAGLSPVPEDISSDFIEERVIHHLNAYQCDIIGPSIGNMPSKRIIVTAIRRAENTWFFKVAGDTVQVEKYRSEYEQFINSLQPH